MAVGAQLIAGAQPTTVGAQYCDYRHTVLYLQGHSTVSAQANAVLVHSTVSAGGL